MSPTISVALIGCLLFTPSFGQADLPWTVGECVQPKRVLNNFVPEKIFNVTWYPQKTIGSFLFDGMGTCPTLKSLIKDSGYIRLLSYSYDTWSGKYKSTTGHTFIENMDPENGYIPVTMNILGGQVPFGVRFYVIAADYDRWSVMYGCREDKPLKLEMGYIVTKERFPNLTDDELQQIDRAIADAELKDSSFEKAVHENPCPPNEPQL